MKRWVRCLYILSIIMILTSCTRSSESNVDKTRVENNPNPSEVFNPAHLRPGVFKVAIPLTDGNFNPLFAKDLSERWVVELVYEGLMQINSEGGYEGNLARSFEKSLDGLSYIFYLKENVLFHDGEVLKAKHIVDSYRIFEESKNNSQFGDFFDALVDLRVLDDYIVEFVFEKNDFYLMSGFGAPIFKNSDSINDPTFMPLGTGPLYLRASKTDEWTFYRFEQHHEKNLAFQSLVLKSVGFDRSLHLLESGSFDVGYIRPNIETQQKVEQIPFLGAFENASNVLSVIGLNFENDLFSDKKVRQALVYGLNRLSFINDQWPIATELSFSVIGQNHWAFPKDQALDVYSYDVGKAERLLEDAGWVIPDNSNIREKEGLPLSFVLYTFADVDWAHNLALQAQRDWALIGIDIKLQVMDFEQLTTAVFQEKLADAWIMAWDIPQEMNPALLIGKKGTAFNAGNFSNDAMEEVFVRLETTFEPEERIDLMSEWISLANEEIPMIPIAFRGDHWGVNSRVSGFGHSAFLSWAKQIDKIQLEQGR